MLESVGLYLSAAGQIRVAERQGNASPYELIKLLDNVDVDDITIHLDRDNITHDDDAGLVLLNMHAYHVEAKADGRAFHVDVTVCLDKADLQRLRAMADMLLAELERD